MKSNSKTSLSKGRRIVPDLRCFAQWRVLTVALLLCGIAAAQTSPIVARAASVTGRAALSSAGAPAFALTSGYLLNPGDLVDTRGGGRVVIDLSDGSMVIVQPGSVVLIKDYRAAASLRELFDITVGQVRVKINHFGGRPNPYRMNSPTASIAVRGTEFSIAVASNGDTRVEVYEGAVEVTSLTNPDQKVLIEAGRAVLVGAGQDFHSLTPVANRDSGDHDGDEVRASAAAPARPTDTHSGPAADHDEISPRATPSTYQQYIASLSSIGQMPFLLRFNAFPEAHLDSLENPAYATGFQQAEGRIFLIPSFNGNGASGQNSAAFGPNTATPVDYSFSPQLSLFTPLGRSGFVVGGSLTSSRVGSGAQTSSPDFDPGLLAVGPNGANIQTSGSSISNLLSGSILVAKRLGTANSFGFEVESLRGSGSLFKTILDPEPPAITTVENINSSSNISQTRFTAGFERDLSSNQHLGVFYRYGLIEANDGDLSHTLNNVPQKLDSTRSSGHSDEFGLRLRGTLSPRLLYGMEASWLGVALNDELTRSVAVDSHQRDRAQRASVGIGLGYLLNRRSVVSFDLAGGTSLARTLRTEDATGAPLQTAAENSRFLSVHFAVQTNLSQRLFVSASLLSIFQGSSVTYGLYPDQFGNSTLIEDLFLPIGPGSHRPASRFSDYGVGWRFSRDLFAQYLYSTDYGYSAASHTLMLRYTLRFHRE